MSVEVYTVENQQVLIQHLLSADLVQKWQEWTAADLEVIIERVLSDHIKRLVKVATDLQGYGVEAVQENDPKGLDLFLTDVFACATWHQYELPIARVADLEDPPAGHCGILQTNDVGAGPQLWLVDDRLYLRRERMVDDSPVEKSGLSPDIN